MKSISKMKFVILNIDQHDGRDSVLTGDAVQGADPHGQSHFSRDGFWGTDGRVVDREPGEAHVAALFGGTPVARIKLRHNS